MRPSSPAARTTMSPVFCSTSMSCRNPNSVIPAIRPTVAGLSDRCSSSARKEMSIGLVNVAAMRSEEHTSELQSQSNLVCRLLLEKKKKMTEDVEIQQHALFDAKHNRLDKPQAR